MKKTKTLPNFWQELLPIDGQYKTAAFNAWTKKNDVFRSGRGIGILAVYYKGDPETSTEWIIVTDDGSYYKHGAVYMVWSNKRVLAAWSSESLLKTVEAFLNEVTAPCDPDYQT